MSFFDRFRRYPELRKVVVNLKSGTAFHALVWRHDGPYVVLREVAMLEDKGEKIEQRAVDGEVAVLRADVDFIQVIG